MRLKDNLYFKPLSRIDGYSFELIDKVTISNLSDAITETLNEIKFQGRLSPATGCTN